MLVESSDTELEEGTGLGLAIVARIVRNMNGQLRAESEEGRGTKFTFAFNFPVPTAAQEAAFLESAASTSLQDNTPMTYTVPLSTERHTQVRRQSNESNRSRGSTNSVKSEIELLVEMIASPRLEDIPRSNNRTQLKRRSSPTAERGNFTVQDSGVPIRPVKVDENEVDVPAAGQSASSPVPSNPAKDSLRPAVSFKPRSLNVLVAEDDPVNRAILKKRLEMDGHQVILTQNGSEVVEKFAKLSQNCDIILMDLQVSICLVYISFTLDAGFGWRVRHKAHP